MKFEKWDVHGYERQTAAAMCREGINPLVALTMASRGFTKASDVRDFMRSDLGMLHDPMLLRDMAPAVERIKKAIANNEHIAVYGDYDVDGMTSSCVAASYFRSLGLTCDIYIPGRLDEGYGLNEPAIDELFEKGVTLIITVDCGITAISETLYAASKGIELIITDHHECKEELPAAVAVIDPKRRDCEYPNPFLAGVGVAFKLICAVHGGDVSELIEDYCDLVAIGTVADVMPMVGENRALVYRGLEILNRTKRPGLKCLMEQACVSDKIVTSSTIGFTLSPRLNAAGRMSRTSVTIGLLLTGSEEEGVRLAAELDGLNAERRSIESRILDEAMGLIDDSMLDGPLILSREDWFQGVLGIVATRLSEHFYLPSILISTSDGIGRGSCRSFGKFPIYEGLLACSDLLENFGGHEMAAGLTILEKNIPEFRRRMKEFYKSRVKAPPVSTLRVDFEAIKPRLLTMDNVTELMKLEPFGSGNLPPVICMKRAVLQNANSVGGGLHTRVHLVKNGESFDGIFFSKPIEEINAGIGDLVDAAFNVQINHFRGRKSVQLLMHDIRKHVE